MALLNEVLSATGTVTIDQASKVLASRFTSYDGKPFSLNGLLAAARQMDVDVVFAKNTPYEGRYRKEGSREEILLKEVPNQHRIKFTLAHEIGHMLIARLLPHRAGERYRSRTCPSAAEEERLANAIAAEILMPTDQFRICLRNNGQGFDGLRAAQNLFGASRAATLRRMSEVTRKSVLFMNVIPRNIFDANEPCIVDECTIVRAGSQPRAYRDEVAILASPKFIELRRSRWITLSVRTPGEKITAEFECRLSKTPCENADLLSVV